MNNPPQMCKDPAIARDSTPSFVLKCKAYLQWNGIYFFIFAFNLCALFNIAQSRIYLILLYALIYILCPGTWGCQYGDGGIWESFSAKFTPLITMRQYLGFSINNDRPLPKEFVKEEAEPNAQFIFATFPHGCGCEFRIIMDSMMKSVMPNIIAKNGLRVLTASVLFYIPFLREFSLWTSCINANRKTAEKALARNRSLLVLPGGEMEQLMTNYGEEIIYLSKRKGFIKLGMRKGVPVVPMYVFGCSDYFYTSNLFYNLRYKLMKNFGICIPLCAGLGGSLCPLPKKTTVVFGKPLHFKMEGEEPTDDELNAAHALFITEITALFDEHKGPLGYGDRKLKVM
jgi:1-acyl-sn-glycerol-3-phosphate acyltransferase